MKFTATEIGCANGSGGASNSKSDDPYHYVLFAQRTDRQHPTNSGIYFEYDGQGNASVNQVKEVCVRPLLVEFKLKKNKVIAIDCSRCKSDWKTFLEGIRSIFPPRLAKKKSNQPLQLTARPRRARGS